MKTTWDRIFTWLAANAPVVLENLNPGAPDEQLRQTEQALGVPLPEDVRTMYRLFDGQREGTSFIEGFSWLSLENVVILWRFFKERLDAGQFPSPQRFEWLGREMVSPVHGSGDAWWNTAWIPLTEDGNGNHHYLDVSQAGGGRIVRYNEGDWALVAPSFGDWLKTFADDLDRGAYVVEDYGPSPR
jgi:cell wall assembly regulator SMI1